MILNQKSSVFILSSLSLVLLAGCEGGDVIKLTVDELPSLQFELIPSTTGIKPANSDVGLAESTYAELSIATIEKTSKKGTMSSKKLLIGFYLMDLQNP